ncbi:MAG: hypothetical protein WA005_07130 [Candidatus Binataceae bacterium]
MAAADLERGSAYSDSDAKSLLDRPDVRIVQPSQVREAALVVEMELERIFGGRLGNDSMASRYLS